MKIKHAQDYLSMIEWILEEKQVYLEKDMITELIALRLGIEQRKLKRAVLDTVGLSLDNLIDMYRVVYAKTLFKNGVPYDDLWTLSGFKSLERMESAFECIVV